MPEARSEVERRVPLLDPECRCDRNGLHDGWYRQVGHSHAEIWSAIDTENMELAPESNKLN